MKYSILKDKETNINDDSKLIYSHKRIFQKQLYGQEMKFSELIRWQLKTKLQ